MKFFKKNFSPKIKIKASNSFVSGFSDLEISRERVVEKKIAKAESYQSVFSEADLLLKRFLNGDDFDDDLFHSCAEKLFNCIKLKPKEYKGYYYLAWLFVLADFLDESENYLTVALSINPQIIGAGDLFDFIREKRKLLSNHTTVKMKPLVSKPQSVRLSDLNDKEIKQKLSGKDISHESLKVVSSKKFINTISNNMNKSAKAYSMYR